jgi:hypothetical protein
MIWDILLGKSCPKNYPVFQTRKAELSGNSGAPKPAAIMGASRGAIGTACAKNHPPRRVLVYHAMDHFDQEGNLTDLPTRERIIGLLRNRVDWAGRIGRNETGRAILA